MCLIKRIIYNMQGIFDLQKAGSIPAPVGFEINEGDGIMYLGSVFDKLSMRRDRINMYKDLNKAVKYVKDGQTGKAN